MTATAHDPVETIIDIRANLAEDENLNNLTSEAIIGAFRSLDELTVEVAILQAKLLAILEQRGYDIDQLRLGRRRYLLQRIANDTLMPEVYVAFAGSVTAVQKIAMLPLVEQKRIYIDRAVRIMVPVDPTVEKISYTARMLDPEQLSPDQLNQVFDTDPKAPHVRPDEAQIAWIEAQRTRESIKRGKGDVRRFGNLQVDRVAHNVRMVSGRTASTEDLIAAAKWLGATT